MKTVFLLLGSNLDDRQANLETATALLEESAGQVEALSPIYVTAAWGFEDQPDFFNRAVALKTTLEPLDLLRACLDIEARMGRKRIQKWGQRIIDVDILFYGDEVVSTDELQVPHPQIPFRRFTLVPLADIAPDLMHPILHRTVKELLEDCTDPLTVSKH